MHLDLNSIDGSFVIKRPASYTAGIYFLVDFGKIVYIGQSISVESRVGTHYKEGSKVFDAAMCVPLCKKYHDLVEGVLIRAVQPILNGKQASSSNPDAFHCRPNKTNLSDTEVVRAFLDGEDIDAVSLLKAEESADRATFTMPEREVDL